MTLFQSARKQSPSSAEDLSKYASKCHGNRSSHHGNTTLLERKTTVIHHVLQDKAFRLLPISIL
jgi:tRNA/tmRNA/rRNA uracil-C5-methylase (TrmA/RlmC/RlmD family)